MSGGALGNGRTLYLPRLKVAAFFCPFCGYQALFVGFMVCWLQCNLALKVVEYSPKVQCSRRGVVLTIEGWQKHDSRFSAAQTQ